MRRGKCPEAGSYLTQLNISPGIAIFEGQGERATMHRDFLPLLVGLAIVAILACVAIAVW